MTDKKIYTIPQYRSLNLATAALCAGSEEYVGDDAWSKKKDWNDEDDADAEFEPVVENFWS